MKVEYFVKYDWYGYEGTSCNNCEYESNDVSIVHRFLNDDEFRNCELKRLHIGGFIERIHIGIFKRTIVETMVDYKQELRNEKINKIMN